MTYLAGPEHLPPGYRWATAYETEHWTQYGEGSLTADEVWVNVGTDFDGTQFFDLAVPIEFTLPEPAKTCPPIPGILDA